MMKMIDSYAYNDYFPIVLSLLTFSKPRRERKFREYNARRNKILVDTTHIFKE